MKKAIVYERKGQLFVRTSSQTTTWLWAEIGSCSTLTVDTDAETLGKAVRDHLDASKKDVLHPPDWKSAQEPLLSAAGVKSWNSFGKTARAVAIELLDDGALTVQATKNNKPGFEALDGGLTRLDGQAEPRTLGEAVKAALSRSV